MLTLKDMQLALSNLGLAEEKLRIVEINELVKILEENEILKRAVPVKHDEVSGIVVTSNLRMIFVSATRNTFDAPPRVEIYYYEEIKKIQLEKGLKSDRMTIFIKNQQFSFDSSEDVLLEKIVGYLEKYTGKKRELVMNGYEESKMVERKFDFKDIRRCLNRLDDFEEQTILMDEAFLMLRGGEAFVAGIEGIYNSTHKGILLATNQRVVILYLGPYNVALQDSFPYDPNRISDLNLGLVTGDMIVFRSGDYFAVNDVTSGRYKEAYDYMIERIYGLRERRELQDFMKSKEEIHEEKSTSRPEPIKEDIKIVSPPLVDIISNENLAESKPGGNPYIEKMRELNIAIEDKTISDHLDELEVICQDIFAYVEKYPERESEIKDFVNDYLPKTFRLLEKYDELSTKALKTQNINHAMDEITQVLGVIVEAIKNLYDKIYENEAMMISSDIKVLKNILTQHGLTKESHQFDFKK